MGASFSGVRVWFDGRLLDRERWNREAAWTPEPADADRVLAAYRKYGRDLGPRLDGEYAIAIHDEAEDAWICLRDRIGIRPLFWRGDAQGFHWSTDLGALIAGAGAKPEPDPLMLAWYLAWHFPRTERTFFRGIRRLPPGSVLVWKAGRASVRTYWDPVEEIRGPAVSSSDYAGELRERFGEAVRDCLDGDGPVGSLLSGGMDSSSIVRAAASLRPEGALPVFSLRLEGFPGCDDRELAAAAADHPALVHHWVDLGERGPFSGWDEGQRRQVEPVACPNLFLHEALIESAAARGVRTLLDGNGGDELFPAPSCLLPDLWAFGDRSRFREEWARLGREQGISRWRLATGLARHRVPGSWKRPLRVLVPERPPAWLRREAARDAGVWNLRRFRPAPEPGLPIGSQDCAWRLGGGLLPLALEELDRSAAAAGVRVRFPFFDSRLARWLLRVPPWIRSEAGDSKALLRRALRGALPEAVAERRTKSDLAPYFYGAFRRQAARPEGSFTRECHPLLAELVDPALAGQAIRRFIAGDDRAGMETWRLLTAQLWLRSLRE